MSDTHGFHKALAPPAGDVFLHCGDHSEFTGTEEETRAFLGWVGKLPHKHKIIIPGNHDLWCAEVNMREVAELWSPCMCFLMLTTVNHWLCLTSIIILCYLLAFD